MWRIEKEFKFEAAHFLPNHDGKCKRMHGHSWVGRAILEGQGVEREGPKAGMLMDFGDITAAIENTVEDRLDHHLLNDTLDLENPTAEMIASYLYHAWKNALPGLVAVRIEETCTSGVEYRR